MFFRKLSPLETMQLEVEDIELNMIELQSRKECLQKKIAYLQEKQTQTKEEPLVEPA